MANISDLSWPCQFCKHVNKTIYVVRCEKCGEADPPKEFLPFELAVPLEIVYDDETRIPFKKLSEGVYELVFDPKLDEKKVLELCVHPFYTATLDPKTPGKLLFTKTNTVKDQVEAKK